MSKKNKRPSKGEPGYCADNYTQSWGDVVDLNDPETYEKGWFKEHSKLGADELRQAISNAIGYSLYYMICWHPDVDWNRQHGPHPGQYARVVQFGKNYAREVRSGRGEDVKWLRKQLYLILDETENQC